MAPTSPRSLTTKVSHRPGLKLLGAFRADLKDPCLHSRGVFLWVPGSAPPLGEGSAWAGFEACCRHSSSPKFIALFFRELISPAEVYVYLQCQPPKKSFCLNKRVTGREILQSPRHGPAQACSDPTGFYLERPVLRAHIVLGHRVFYNLRSQTIGQLLWKNACACANLSYSSSTVARAPGLHAIDKGLPFRSNFHSSRCLPSIGRVLGRWVVRNRKGLCSRSFRA